MLQYTTRPISDRTWMRGAREPTRFSAKWSNTLDVLAREYEELDGSHLVIEVDVAEKDIRNDGMLRADAKATSVAVVVAFDSKHGSMKFHCDTFYANYAHQGPGWQHNVRAIALTLEALRKVDRYGAVDTGQQYTGFKALPSGLAMSAGMSVEQAAAYLLDNAAYVDSAPADLIGNPEQINAYFRSASHRLHPDRGGDPAAFHQLTDARDVLLRTAQEV